MVCAPVLIPTLNRIEHFKKCIRSLANNTLAADTDVYIALDYPPSEKYIKGYYDLIAYLESADFSSFHSFTVVKRKKNYGKYNLRALVEQVSTCHDCWIIAEDDIEFAPGFLSYMNSALEKFKNDESIYAVCGYSYPLNWVASKNANAILLNGICPAWGMGLWRDKELKTQRDLYSGFLIDHFEDAIYGGCISTLNRAKQIDYVLGYFGSNKNMITTATDVARSIYMGITHGMVVSPVVSLTRNHGFDGSGLFCERIDNPKCKNSLDYSYSDQVLSCESYTELRVDESTLHMRQNDELLDEFLYISPEGWIKTKLLVLFSRLLGIKAVIRIIESARAIRQKVKYGSK